MGPTSRRSIQAKLARMTAIEVDQLSHRYGQHRALDQVALSVERGELFGLLGPNGSGKTTLFRILSTLLRPQVGAVRVMGIDVSVRPYEARQRMGVVFQSSSIDRKLTVLENLQQQAVLFGLTGRQRQQRIEAMLAQLGLEEYRHQRAERLSGGYRRRLDVAKGLLHQPDLLLLDEPTTALDPAVRADLWRYLRDLRTTVGTTIVWTTHLLDEAEFADRVAIFDQGKRVALDAPESLRRGLGGDRVTIQSDDHHALASELRARFGWITDVVDQEIQVRTAEATQAIAELMTTYGHRVRSITVGKPTLADVFMEKTGHRFWQDRHG